MTEARAVPEASIGRGPAAPARALFLLASGLCACSLALAAPDPEVPPDPDLSIDALRKVGPLWLGPYFNLRDVGYDDNVFFDSREGEGDFTATAVPGLRALLRTGHRGGVAFGQELSYVAFKNNSQLDHWNSDSRARGILLMGPSVLSLEERFRSDRERPSNEIDTRVRRSVNELTAMARIPLRDRLGGHASLRAGSIRYVDGEGIDDIKERLDRDNRTVELTGEMRVRPRTTATLETILDDVNFRSPEQVRDTRSITVLPGLRLDASAPISGEVKAGVVSLNAPGGRLDPGDPNSPIPADYKGFAGEGAVAARLGNASRLKLEAERALPFSMLENNLYAIQTTWAAGFERFFSRKLSAELRYGRTLYHYPEELIDADDSKRTEARTRDDRLKTWEMKLYYRLGDDFALTGSVQRQRRDSTDDSLDRDRDLITFGTSLLL